MQNLQYSHQNLQYSHMGAGTLRTASRTLVMSQKTVSINFRVKDETLTFFQTGEDAGFF